MPDKEEDTFCKKMRKATREIHTISDTLVNAKLAFAFLDDSVWGDGLLVFYEIFRYLEGAMIRLKNTKIGLLPLSELQRTDAFENDLDHYLGKGWMKDYSPRDSVIKYLMRLREVEDTDPTLLMAYIYHLYMGLLSGGNVLRKKRQYMQSILPLKKAKTGGNSVLDFGNNSIFELKRNLCDAMNKIAETLDEDTRNKLIEESKIVFELNNEIIRSVRGAGTIMVKKLLYFIVAPILIIFAFYILLK